MQVKVMETLSIGIVAPTYLPIPCPGYGGIEPVIYDLARAVAKRGHQVTLIAAQNSPECADYELYKVTGGRQRFDDEQVAFGQYADLLGAFDIVSDHTHQHFSYLQRCVSPDIIIQTTRHSQWNPQVPPPKSPNPNVPLPEPRPYNFCGISNHHSRECSGMSGMVFRTLYDGLDLSSYPFQEKKVNRLLFVGRMEPFKGAQWAVQAAIALRMPLDLIGKDHDTNQDFVKQLKAIIQEAKGKGYDIEYLGEVDHATKLKYLQNAKCLLFPALWNEPFGLCPIEAAACGTPTVGTTNGALPEIVSHSRTGWLAGNIDEFISYIPKADQIRPADCRAWVQERFSSEVMVNAYLQVWSDCLNGKGW